MPIECCDFTESTFLVTGGCGYVGRRLVRELILLGAKKVHVLDIKKKKHNKHRIECQSRIEHFIGDIKSIDLVRRACKGVTLVFHLASYGMSGREMLQRELIYGVNVVGTQNIIQACIECNVPMLIYTSTYNVVFGGSPLENKDESVPYYPLEMHVDEYSRTKSIAEQMIISANGSLLKNQAGKLSTCALRPAAIYGEGEERHLPRIVNYMQRGLFCFLIGSCDSKVEFVYIDNLVLAHVLAAKKLLLLSHSFIPARESLLQQSNEENYDIRGQCYFISDQSPINNFEFFRPLFEALGMQFPFIRFPVFFMYYLAFLFEIIYMAFRPLYDFQPLLTRAEVLKVSVTHYFNPIKSQRELGYKPKINSNQGMLRVAHYWQQKLLKQDHSKRIYNKGVLLIHFLLLLFISFPMGVE